MRLSAPASWWAQPPTFAEGDPFLAGGGAVDLVDLDEVWWTEPPEREEAGSPNVMGAVALEAALEELGRIGWEHDRGPRTAPWPRGYGTGLAAIDGVRVLGPSLDTDTLAIAAFVVEGVDHALVAARLSAEWGIGVRHGCFCAHPYLIRLLGLAPPTSTPTGRQVRAGDHRAMPGAVRASCGISSTEADVDALLDAVPDHRRGRRGGAGAAGPLRPGRGHRRLLAGERGAGMAGPRTRDRRLVRAGLSSSYRVDPGLSPSSRGRRRRS